MNINNPKLLWQLNFEGSWPTGIAFLGSGRRLAAANEGGQIYVWDLPETPPAFEAAEEQRAQSARSLAGPPAGRTHQRRDAARRDAATARRSSRPASTTRSASGSRKQPRRAQPMRFSTSTSGRARRSASGRTKFSPRPAWLVETLSAAHTSRRPRGLDHVARRKRRLPPADQRRCGVAGDRLGPGRAEGNRPLERPSVELDRRRGALSRRPDGRRQRIPLQARRFRHPRRRPARA